MTDATRVAALLLVLGPVIGLIPVASPQLIHIWSAPREVYLSTVRAHRRAWHVLNAGFAFATILTSAGLAALAVGGDPRTASGALLVALAIAYALGGVAWLAVLAIRAVRDPRLGEMVAAGHPTEPGEALLGAATSGLYGAWVLITGAVTVLLAAVLGASGELAFLVSVVAAAIGVGVVLVLLRTGDVVAAIPYAPTLLIGLALLAGWT